MSKKYAVQVLSNDNWITVAESDDFFTADFLVRQREIDGFIARSMTAEQFASVGRDEAGRKVGR
jgi:hypothetical protein